MPSINTELMYLDLDKLRRGNRWSWRELSKEMKINNNTLSRLAYGGLPSLMGFVKIVHFLGVKSERYYRD